jgi:hypothetical protein
MQLKQQKASLHILFYHAVEAAKASSIEAPDFCFFMQLKIAAKASSIKAPDFCCPMQLKQQKA